MEYENELRELNLMQQIYATIFTLTNKIQAQGDKCLENLTVRQFMTMLAILHLPEGETTFNRIAAKTGTTKQNVNNIIAALEKKGFVETKSSPTDKRAMNVEITELGAQTMLSGSERSVYFLSDLFTAFSGDELELLWALLKKLYQFDGQPQDGFEDDVSAKIAETNTVEQTRILEEFRRRRARHGGI